MPASERTKRPWSPAARWLTAAFISLGASAILIRHSIEHGGLALPPTYDDVSYLLDGAHYLDVFDLGGVPAILRTYIANPPHAPISTAAAFVGFAVLGFHNWIGAVTNAVLLFLCSGLFLHAVRDLPRHQAVFLLILLWTSPFAGMTLWWFRPDMFASLVVAFGAMFIMSRERWICDGRAWVIAGCFIGAALWAKPPIFPLTLALFGLATFLASFAELLRGQWLPALKAGVISFGMGIAIALPYYAFEAREVVNYIYTVVFGSEADIWVHPLGLRETLTFYLTGYYGQISAGWWIYAGVAIGIVSTVLAAARRDRRRLGTGFRVIGFVVLCYVAVTVPTFKGPHGFPFAASLLVASIMGCAVILRRVPRPVGSALCLAAIVVSLSLFQWPFTVAQRFVTAAESRSRWRVVDNLVQALGGDLQSKTVMFSTSTSYTNFSVVEFALRQQGKGVPQWVVPYTSGDLGEHQRAFSNADIVVAYSPDENGVIPILPTATPEFRARFIDTVEKSDQFEQARKIADPLDGGNILVFDRKPSASKVEVVQRDGVTSGSAAFASIASVGDRYALASPTISQRGAATVVALTFHSESGLAQGEALFFHLLDKEGRIIGQLDRSLCQTCADPAKIRTWIERFTIPEVLRDRVTSVGFGIYDPSQPPQPPFLISGQCRTDWAGRRGLLELVPPPPLDTN